MNKIFKYSLILVLISVSGYVSAQKATKFGHINTQELIQVMPERDSAEVKLQAYAKELDANLETMQVELNKKIEEYQKNQGTWADLVKQTKASEIQDFQQRIQAYQEQAQQGITAKQNELMQPIVAKAKKAIDDIGKENGFTMIFETSAIQYMAADVQDVLPLVKTKLGIKAAAAATAPAGAAATKK